jgi:hypothetical protein
MQMKRSAGDEYLAENGKSAVTLDTGLFKR